MPDERPQPSRPEPRETYALRLRQSERRQIQTAALMKEMTLSSYLRQVAVEAARRDLTAV